MAAVRLGDGITGSVTLTVDRGPTQRMTITVPLEPHEAALEVIDRLRAVFAATDAADQGGQRQ